MFQIPLKIILITLIAVCIFDSASKLLGLKEILFVLGWTIFILDIISDYKNAHVSLKLLTYLLVFIFIIPFISITYYLFTGSDFINYDGYIYFKPYLFLSVVIILYVSKIDLIKPTIIILSLLSILTISVFICISTNFLEQFLYSSIVNIQLDIGERTYGGFVFPEIHFHTSALIIFPIGYYSLAFLDSKGLKRIFFGILLIINMIGMFLGGTRNNILVSIITPILIVLWYSKRRILILSVIIAVMFIGVGIYQDTIKEMFDTEEPSNSIRLSFKEDYFKLFYDSNILLFGQGLGSYFNTTARGYVSLTELTYFEFIRRFGLILSSICFLFLLFPLSKLRLKQYRNEHYLFICYAFYLVGAFVQPLLMSSTGMLLMSLVLYKTFTPPLNSNSHISY